MLSTTSYSYMLFVFGKPQVAATVKEVVKGQLQCSQVEPGEVLLPEGCDRWLGPRENGGSVEHLDNATITTDCGKQGKGCKRQKGACTTGQRRRMGKR